jgi:hypothetical protein
METMYPNQILNEKNDLMQESAKTDGHNKYANISDHPKF